MTKHRFHPVYALAVLKRPALVCLLPLIQALERLDLAGLVAALWQELALILLLALLGTALWRQAWWSFEDGVLRWQGGWGALGFCALHSLPAAQAASAAVCRAWYLRPVGAARLELGTLNGETRRLLLPRRRAEALAAALIPPPAPEQELSPSRGERVLLALLGCDLPATLVLLVLALRSSAQIMGREWTQQMAGQGLRRATQLASRLVPASLAGIAALLALAICATLTLSGLQVSRFRLRRGGTVLESVSGVFSPTHWLLRTDCVTCADLRRTPLARLVGRYPLALTVGGYTGAPVLLCRTPADERLERLLPGLSLPQCRPLPRRLCVGRTPLPFLLAPGLTLALLALAWLRLVGPLPYFGPPLAVALGLCGLWLWVGWEGWRQDRAAPARGGALLVVYTRFFTHHCCCLLRPTGARTLQNPFTRRWGRCDLTLFWPGRKPLKVYGLRQKPLRGLLRRTFEAPEEAS